MRLTGDPAPGTMNSSSGSGNFLLVPIPEYPLLDCVPNKTVKIVVLGASNVGKTGMDVHGGAYWSEGGKLYNSLLFFFLRNTSYTSTVRFSVGCWGFATPYVYSPHIFSLRITSKYI